ncbi:MAG: hypothetical protein IJ874_10865 [Ruminococcus sp.]|nr:hypothetical protein [Ruminococcus sp.]
MEVFIPNTGQSVNLNEPSATLNGSDEERAQWIKGEHGYFAGSISTGGSGGGKSAKAVDSSGKSAIIKGRGSGTGSTISDEHTYEKIGTIDIDDNEAVAGCLSEFESKYSDSDIEHCRVICTNGDVYEIHGDRYTVDTSLLGERMNGSINEHNHVTSESQYSFSWEDIDSSAKDFSHITMAYDEKYRYSMIFPEKPIDTDMLREAYDISENEVMLINYNYQYYSIGSKISDEDYQHEVIKRTCERVGVKYERKPKT